LDHGWRLSLTESVKTKQHAGSLMNDAGTRQHYKYKVA